MEDMGVIAKQDGLTDLVNSMITVRKPGTICICVDPKNLNQHIKREHFNQWPYKKLLNDCRMLKLIQHLMLCMAFSTFSSMEKVLKHLTLIHYSGDTGTWDFLSELSQLQKCSGTIFQLIWCQMFSERYTFTWRKRRGTWWKPHPHAGTL